MNNTLKIILFICSFIKNIQTRNSESGSGALESRDHNSDHSYNSDSDNSTNDISDLHIPARDNWSAPIIIIISVIAFSFCVFVSCSICCSEQTTNSPQNLRE